MDTRTNTQILKDNIVEILNYYWSKVSNSKEGMESYINITGYLSSFIFSYKGLVKVIRNLEDLFFELHCQEDMELSKEISKDLKSLKESEYESWRDMEKYMRDRTIDSRFIKRLETRMVEIKAVEKKYEKEFEYSKWVDADYKD